MARSILLAVLTVAALCVAAPAQADVLPVDPQATVASAQQTPATAVAAVASTAEPATRTLTGAARHDAGASGPNPGPAVSEVVSAASRGADGIAAAATQAVAPPAAPREPAARSAQSSFGQGESAGSARFRQGRAAQAGRGERTRFGRADVARSAAPQGLASRTAASPSSPDAAGHPSQGARTAEPQRRSPAPQPDPSTGAGTAASSGGGSAPFGGLALLAAAVCLAAPRLRRRLLIRPAEWRPVAFVSLLERPG